MEILSDLLVTECVVLLSYLVHLFEFICLGGAVVLFICTAFNYLLQGLSLCLLSSHVYEVRFLLESCIRLRAWALEVGLSQERLSIATFFLVLDISGYLVL